MCSLILSNTRRSKSLDNVQSNDIGRYEERSDCFLLGFGIGIMCALLWDVIMSDGIVEEGGNVVDCGGA